MATQKSILFQIFQEMRALEIELQKEDRPIVEPFVVLKYNQLIDEALKAGLDLTSNKIRDNLLKDEGWGAGSFYQARDVKFFIATSLGRLKGKIGDRYDTSDKQITHSGPLFQTTFMNNNTNAVNVETKISFENLFKKIEDLELKEKLLELESELESKEKDETKIKKVIIWLINRSWEVFLQVLPILLQHYGK